MIWDILGAAGFVLAMAAIMGVFSRSPRSWGYPPVRKPSQGSLLGVVLPAPRVSTDEDADAEQTAD